MAERPVKQGKTKVSDRWFNYLHVTCGDRTLLRRRGERDIWQGLYEFPLIESPGPADFAELAVQPCFHELLGDAPWRLVRSIAMPRHQLSHQTLHALFHRIGVDRLPRPEGYLTVPVASLGDYAVPRLIEKYLEQAEDRQKN